MKKLALVVAGLCAVSAVAAALIRPKVNAYADTYKTVLPTPDYGALRGAVTSTVPATGMHDYVKLTAAPTARVNGWDNPDYANKQEAIAAAMTRTAARTTMMRNAETLFKAAQLHNGAPVVRTVLLNPYGERQKLATALPTETQN